MSFPPAFLVRLKEQADLVAVAGKRIKLTRKGREYSAHCPFHPEKTPSFTINPDKGFYHCFGCQAHGDALSFLIEFDKLSFVEGVKALAAETGLRVPEETKEAREQQDQTQKLRSICTLAAQWFSQQLASPVGSIARQYLESRGIITAMCGQFSLGYAPSGNKLAAFLAQKNIPQKLAVEAGLIGIDSEKNRPYDRFRHRLIFPIYDSLGVVAFGGRSLDGTEPKYLNSPETPLFHKGSLLYGLPTARRAAKNAPLLVAEGYMDVIALHQAGFTTAVAPLGTALTEDHVRLLWQVCDTPILCLDGDAAGQRAAARAAERALMQLKAGKSLAFITLPLGEDPDSLIRAQGAAHFAALLSSPRPLSQQLLQMAVEGQNLTTPDGKAAVLKRLEQYASGIGDKTLAGFYRRDLTNALYGLLRHAKGNSVGAVQRTKAGSVIRERTLLKVCWHFPHLADAFSESLSYCQFEDATLEQLRQTLLSLWQEYPAATKETYAAELQQRGLGAALGTLTEVPIDYRGKNDAEIMAGFRQLHGLVLGLNNLRQERIDIHGEHGIRLALNRERQIAALVETDH